MKKTKDLIAILKAYPQMTLLFLTVVICVVVFFALVIISFSSKPSNTPPTLTEAQQEKYQQQDDTSYNKVVSSAQNKYPWFDNLPPKNSKYFVAFSEADQTFYVSLYVKNNPSLENSYKQQLYLDLKNIGVATQSYKFNWFIR